MNKINCVIVGGGAAGFFAALAVKGANPQREVILIERTAQLLSKVRISGGGRCNVTHSCFDPRELVKHYPRGSKELIGPFHRFQPQDTIEWFRKRGVELKTEKDGRMFPLTDSSETIIDCLLSEAKKLGIKIWTQCKLKSIQRSEQGFLLDVWTENLLTVEQLIMATGSSRNGWEFVKSLGHTVVDPVPSLFTFNIPKFPLVDLAGASVNPARIRIAGTKLEQAGPLLVTHWGFSGPAALKLSAFGARTLAEKQYQASVLVDWLPEMAENELRERLINEEGAVQQTRFSSIPKKLWKRLTEQVGIEGQTQWTQVGNAKVNRLVERLKRDSYQVSGKTTNKEEFVTCGGVRLSEVNFKTMESKVCPGLFFAGEILDIDGITGGFNFQNAWTTGWIAGNSI